MDKFPRLYVISLDRGKTINKMGTWNRNGNSEDFMWQIPWRRELFVWEKELENQLMVVIHSVQ